MRNLFVKKEHSSCYVTDEQRDLSLFWPLSKMAVKWIFERTFSALQWINTAAAAKAPSNHCVKSICLPQTHLYYINRAFVERAKKRSMLSL